MRTLEYIAYQDPYYGGAAAVYGAQAMLGIDVSYGSDDGANRMMLEDETKAEKHWMLAPQPATDYAELLNFYLNEGDKCIIELYDVTGRKLSLQQFQNMEYPVKINLAGFAPGIYGYKVYLNDTAVMSDKLIIK